MAKLKTNDTRFLLLLFAQLQPQFPNMHDFLKPLLELHARDLERLHLEKQLASVPHELARLEAKIKAQQDTLGAKKAQMKALDKHRQDLEHALYAQEAILDRCKTQQPLVKKQDEYEALGKQMEESVQKISALEDAILDDLSQTDTLKAEFSQLQHSVQDDIAAIRKEIDHIHAQKAKLEADHAVKAAQCASCAQAIPLDALKMYQVAQSRAKQPPFIATISEGRCQGCYIKLSNEILGKVKMKDALVACDQCGRLLVAVEMLNQSS